MSRILVRRMRASRWIPHGTRGIEAPASWCARNSRLVVSVALC